MFWEHNVYVGYSSIDFPIFGSLPTYGGYDELVTGHFEYGGDYKALQICPGGSVFSTYSRDVRDISSVFIME